LKIFFKNSWIITNFKRKKQEFTNCELDYSCDARQM